MSLLELLQLFIYNYICVAVICFLSPFAPKLSTLTCNKLLCYIQIDNTNREADDPSAAEVEEILNAILRFKDYTCFISDEALVRLMTSLVTLSLNSFGTTQTSSPFSYLSSSSSNNVPGLLSGDSSNTARKQRYSQPQLHVHSLPYLQEGINQGAMINFSLLTVIEVSKLNSFRASCIWQIVTSHLRIIASMKNSGTRYVAVAATLDVVKSALSECVSSSPRGTGRRELLSTYEEVSRGASVSLSLSLSLSFSLSVSLSLSVCLSLSLSLCHSHSLTHSLSFSLSLSVSLTPSLTLSFPVSLALLLSACLSASLSLSLSLFLPQSLPLCQSLSSSLSISCSPSSRYTKRGTSALSTEHLHFLQQNDHCSI